jgi:hypothetical protein
MVLLLVAVLPLLPSKDALALRWHRHNQRITILRAGYFGPKDAKSGFVFGLGMGNAVDEVVDIGVSIDLFHRAYQKDVQIAESVSSGGLVERTVQRMLDFSTTAVPVLGTVTLNFTSKMPFRYFVGAGLGYLFLWNKETNYALDVSERRYYRGFAWRLEGGVLYQLGSRSALMIEAVYDGARPRRNEHRTAQGLPIWQEVNFSGFGVRIGIRIGGF